MLLHHLLTKATDAGELPISAREARVIKEL